MIHIELEGIHKSFDGHTRVLQDIDLQVKKGELVTLLGPSGCGKSTLLRCLAGFIPTDGGTIRIGGQVVDDLPPKERKVGMVFQQYSLFPTMTVAENIGFGLRMKKKSRETIRERVNAMLQMVELEGMENRYPAALSGGQKQRVALARAIVTEPEVLLLDEPLSAIDAKLRKSLQSFIRQIQRRLGITTIFVTHDQDEAMLLSDRIVLMHRGRIEQHDEPIRLYTQPKTEFAASFIGNYNVFSRDQFLKLGGESSAASIALRPEAISIHKTADQCDQRPGALIVPGTIRDMTPRGNILSYVVEANGVTLKADSLFRSHALFARGESVLLEFEKRNCLEVA